MGLPSVATRDESARYCWQIFNAEKVRKSELGGTPYRYWSSFAIAYLLGQRLSGRIDFLDAGGRDGGTLELLKALALRGTYTLVDLEPKLRSRTVGEFEIEVVRSPFRDFKPHRKFDAILFQSCLECVESYEDIAWARDCLKPGGFILATIACKDTRRLYPGFWEQGGRYLLDERDLAPAFAGIGLRIVWACPLGGAISRICQFLIHTRFSDFVRRVHRATTAKLFPRIEKIDPLAKLYWLVNSTSARLDRLVPLWPIGHCVLLESGEKPPRG